MGLLLSSAYLAPVHYYTKLYSSALAQVRSGGTEGLIIEEQADHYVKQTYRNRCIIAGDDGPIALTVPVTAPNHTPMHSVLISDHGDWRRQHWNAIVSAYRSSPYFEYYADDFSTIFHDETALLVDFNAALRDFILDSLDLHPQIVVNREQYIKFDSTPKASCLPNETSSQHAGAPSLLGRAGGEASDFRETIRPKIPYTFDPTFRPVPYWQVFAHRHGFQPNLSIIDLLFNMGPESRIILRDSLVM